MIKSMCVCERERERERDMLEISVKAINQCQATEKSLRFKL